MNLGERTISALGAIDDVLCAFNATNTRTVSPASKYLPHLAPVGEALVARNNFGSQTEEGKRSNTFTQTFLSHRNFGIQCTALHHSSSCQTDDGFIPVHIQESFDAVIDSVSNAFNTWDMRQRVLLEQLDSLMERLKAAESHICKGKELLYKKENASFRLLIESEEVNYRKDIISEESQRRSDLSLQRCTYVEQYVTMLNIIPPIESTPNVLENHEIEEARFCSVGHSDFSNTSLNDLSELLEECKRALRY